MDVLNISLSHITGQSIVHGNKDAMFNLLEVLSGLMDFMQEEIASDSQSIDGKVYIYIYKFKVSFKFGYEHCWKQQFTPLVFVRVSRLIYHVQSCQSIS